MASFFGEIIEPHSRSFVTDGEEYSLEERYDIETIGGDSEEDTQDYEYLVVAYGKILHEFSASYLVASGAQVIEKYNIVSRPSEDDQFCRQKYPSTLYRLSETTALFVCERLPHPYFANSLLVKLKPMIERSAHVVVLTSEHMVNLKPTESATPLVRNLRTATCLVTAVPTASTLHLPNTVSGLPAAVLSWCQYHKKSAILYILYTDSSHLDSISAEPLLQLLHDSHFLGVSLPAAGDQLKHIAHNAQLYQSNLYM